MNDPLFAWSLLSTPLVAAIVVALLGALTGGLSMLLYARISPQSRLHELSTQAGEARLALSRFDGGDIREVLTLTRHAVGVSLRQMGLILGPMLLAGVFVLGTAWLVDTVFHLARLEFAPSWAPSWLGNGYAAFWISLTVGAAALKWALKIK